MKLFFVMHVPSYMARSPSETVGLAFGHFGGATWLRRPSERGRSRSSGIDSDHREPRSHTHKEPCQPRPPRVEWEEWEEGLGGARRSDPAGLIAPAPPTDSQLSSNAAQTAKDTVNDGRQPALKMTVTFSGVWSVLP